MVPFVSPLGIVLLCILSPKPGIIYKIEIIRLRTDSYLNLPFSSSLVGRVIKEDCVVNIRQLLVSDSFTSLGIRDQC